MSALDAVKQMTTATINPDQAAKVLGCDPNGLRLAALQRPELLGFPVIIIGHRVRIPRLPFIRAIEGGSS